MTASEQLSLLERCAYSIRRKFNIGADERFNFSSFREVLPQITLVKCPFTKDVDGLTFKLNTDKSIIAINSCKTVGDYNFALAHELYHHFYSESGAMISKATDFNIKSSRDEEFKANCFAMFLLLPLPAVDKFIFENCEGVVDKKTIIKLCDYFKTSILSVLNRLFLSYYITEEEYLEFRAESYENLIDRNNPYSAFSICDGKYVVEGYYKEEAQRLHNLGKITDSKLNEILAVARGD